MLHSRCASLHPMHRHHAPSAPSSRTPSAGAGAARLGRPSRCADAMQRAGGGGRALYRRAARRRHRHGGGDHRQWRRAQRLRRRAIVWGRRRRSEGAKGRPQAPARDVRRCARPRARPGCPPQPVLLVLFNPGLLPREMEVSYDLIAPHAKSS
eukprot:scaffold13688_cov59-Phaeocystis_antarctica.AAC.2